jgi:hypothetical protein
MTRNLFFAVAMLAAALNLAASPARGQAQYWIRQLGTNQGDVAQAVAPDGAGGAFVAGRTLGNLGGPNAGNDDAWLARWGPCYADCNGDGVLGLADFECFQTKFALNAPYADCNGDGVLGLADFGCFQTKFALGCP